MNNERLAYEGMKKEINELRKNDNEERKSPK
jgi:hypothetical protein